MTGIARRPWGGWASSALFGLALAAVVAGCGSFWIGPKPSPSVAALSPSAAPTPTPSPQYQAPGDLAVGDCFDPINDHDDAEQPNNAEQFAVHKADFQHN